MTTAVLAAVLGFVAILAALFVAMVRKSALDRAADPSELMDADSRSLYGPIRRLAAEVDELAKRHDSATIRILGPEAARESERIREQCARALVVRTELKRAGRGKSLAAREVEDLGRRALEATTEAERTALESAQEARRLELSHYTTVEETVLRIESGIRQAEAVLSEMKTRLSVSSTSERAVSADDGELRETIGRLKSLSVSYDEAEQMLNSR